MAETIEKHGVTISVASIVAITAFILGGGITIGKASQQVDANTKRIIIVEDQIKDIKTMKSDISWIKETLKEMKNNDKK